jgi:hypothetical protein
MENEAYLIDWTRRRLLHPCVASPTHCHHGSKLTEWCGDCAAELDRIAADLLPPASDGRPEGEAA